MNRTRYFNYIEEKLSTLGYRIVTKGRLNILDSHIHCETFYVQLLNKLYSLDFQNANTTLSQNVEAIDLIDTTNRIVCQVSATSTKTKIESALGKDILKGYSGYNFKFISIAKDSSDLRGGTFLNPFKLKFDGNADIVDNKSILDGVLGMTIPEQREIYTFIKDELGSDIDIVKLDSNLADIINVLSKENLTSASTPNLNVFEIDRKIAYNNLIVTQEMIRLHSLFHSRVEKKYREFDIGGSNRSISVLASINKAYVEELAKSSLVPDVLFFNVIDNITQKITSSANFAAIPVEELDLCVNILVVDAFVRCKIFKNPENYQYATA